MISRLKPDFSFREVIAALRLQGPNDVEQFEIEFAKFSGQAYSLSFPYGRTGLMILLQALGLTNREIICPAYTCVVVPHSIVISGNIPVFVDCAESDYNMNLELAERAITEHTGALIATSLFGYPVNLDHLRQLRKKYPRLIVIQDCAHSFLASWQKSSVLSEGVASIFGLNISKLISSIFGGMVTTNDRTLYENLLRVRRDRLNPATMKKSACRTAYFLATFGAFVEPVYPLVHRLVQSETLKHFVKYYDEASIDMPADYLESLSPVEARVGLVQLKKYPQIIARRRELASWYRQELKETPGIILPPLIEGATYSHFVVRVQNKRNVLEEMLASGIECGEVIEYAVPAFQAYRKYHFLNDSVSTRLKDEIINLPLHASIGTKERRRIVDRLKQIVMFTTS